MERVLAILDREEAYVTRLLGYFHNQPGFAGITAAAFTKEESFWNYAATHEVGLLLCEEELYYGLDRKPECRTVLLSGQGLVREEGPPVIFRFQSAHEILEELLGYYEELRPEKQAGRAVAGVRLWTVCGVGSGGGVPFAWVLARKKSREEKIFYLSLDPFFVPAASGARSSALTEAIYFIKQNSRDLKEEHIGKLIRKCERMDCLYGVLHWADISECTAAEMMELLNGIAALGRYDGIIVDAGGFTDASAGAMEISQKVILVCQEEKRQAEREQEFVRQAESREPGFAGKLVKIRQAEENAMLEELCRSIRE